MAQVDDPFRGTLSTALHGVMKTSVDELIPPISRRLSLFFVNIAVFGKFFQKNRPKSVRNEPNSHSFCQFFR
jgi:hypothetical protein